MTEYVLETPDAVPLAIAFTTPVAPPGGESGGESGTGGSGPVPTTGQLWPRGNF